MTFSQFNTEGYSDRELEYINAELAERLAGLEPESDEYQQTAKAFCDEVSRRSTYVAISPEGYLYGRGVTEDDALQDAVDNWAEKWPSESTPEFLIKPDDGIYDL